MKVVEWAYNWEHFMNTYYGMQGKYWDYADIENAKEDKQFEVINGAPVYDRDFAVSPGQPMENQSTEYYDGTTLQNIHNLWGKKYSTNFKSTTYPEVEMDTIWDPNSLSDNVPRKWPNSLMELVLWIPMTILLQNFMLSVLKIILMNLRGSITSTGKTGNRRGDRYGPGALQRRPDQPGT